MNFWQALKASYTGGIAFIMACPLLFAVPVLLEIVQHIVEVHRGMYTSLAAAKMADADPVRMAFGLLKIAALTVAGYWVVRFLAWRDPDRTRRLDPPALYLFGGVLAFQIGIAAIQLFVLPRTVGLLLAETFCGLLIATLCAAWAAAASLGNAQIGPFVSVRIMARHLPWGMALSFVTLLPMMVPHYALAILALLGPKTLLWPLLILDSLVVGVLSAVSGAAYYWIAKRGADRAELGLAPLLRPA